MLITEQYRKRAADEFESNGSSLIRQVLSDGDREQIQDIAASVMMTRDKVLNGGRFVQSIVNNDLKGSLSCDPATAKGIRFYVHCLDYVFL